MTVFSDVTSTTKKIQLIKGSGYVYFYSKVILVLVYTFFSDIMLLQIYDCMDCKWWDFIHTRSQTLFALLLLWRLGSNHNTWIIHLSTFIRCNSYLKLDAKCGSLTHGHLSCACKYLVQGLPTLSFWNLARSYQYHLINQVVSSA